MLVDDTLVACPTPTVSRRQLGRELRRLRETVGLGRDVAAAELECGVSKISKIETGKATLRPAEVKALEDMASADYLPNPTQIAGYLTAFGTLALSALDPAASSIMIKNAALGE